MKNGENNSLTYPQNVDRLLTTYLSIHILQQNRNYGKKIFLEYLHRRHTQKA